MPTPTNSRANSRQPTAASHGRGPSAPLTTGDRIVEIAADHLGEAYIFGARAPMGNPAWTGPWDCAEFASWCTCQASGLLYGTRPQDNPMTADAYTGFWAEQSRNDGARIDLDQAAGIAGAMLLRIPTNWRGGHIAISDGQGGTLEAHSTRRGVIRHTAGGRRWDCGVLVPGITFFDSDQPVTIAPTTGVLRVTVPMIRGRLVTKVQKRLAKLGFNPGTIDGIYGGQTAAAVVDFQLAEGLVADGEVGEATLKALKVRL